MVFGFPCQPYNRRMARSAGAADWPVSCDSRATRLRGYEAAGWGMRRHDTAAHKESGVAGREVEAAAHTIAAQVLGTITLR